MKNKSETKEIEYEDKSSFEKFNFIIDLPFDYARKLTLPPCEAEKYEKKWAVIFPIPGILFIIFAVFMVPQLWWLYVAVPIGGLISFGIYKTS